ncbi:hypothetical protein J31TS4_07560 [Paenibacillus sp. J31TS4]|uniref:hypothetical protein n=1 Tax=Paenibacillus sp. J31TS4 TaxID=2807195 RepID=UPI001B03F6C4|nr:hypothetical protein [Paenibacillus sp. J31TS4]GIP37476.1 hypothetical protein J31TS4_07560 [Paenibacillus sp. J31TS4]
MKWLSAVLTTSLVTAMLALFLSLIPEWDRMNRMDENELTVFRQASSDKLSDHNLVDKLTRVKLKLPIQRAEWKNGVLSIDLVYDTEAGSAGVYQDLYELASFGFQSQTNVTQVRVRVVDSASRRGELLATMDARKEDTDTLPALTNVNQLAGFLESTYRVAYTSQWKGRVTR